MPKKTKTSPDDVLQLMLEAMKTELRQDNPMTRNVHELVIAYNELKISMREA